MMDILNAREQRAKHIENLLQTYKKNTVVILKLNVVGQHKNPQYVQFVLRVFNNYIKKQFLDKIMDSAYIKSDDGHYFYYIIHEQAQTVKRKTIVLEECCPLGRLTDIDVYSDEIVNRSTLNHPQRTCFICEKDARICARNKTHSEKEINRKTRQIVEQFLLDYVSGIVEDSIHSELKLYPKAGLVSYVDSGCHKDMNYHTFLRSKDALKPFIKEYIQTGFLDDIDPEKLRSIGIEAENKMFEATKGINTHKGLNFLLGVFLPALTNTIIHNEDNRYLSQKIASLSSQIIGNYYQELNRKSLFTHGDEIYLQTGIKGVREEALNGLKTIFSIERCYGEKFDCLHQYLIEFMARINDTTIIAKTDVDTLYQVQKQMKEILQSGGYKHNKELFLKRSSEYKEHNISPGGSADLLVIKMIYEETRWLLNHTSKKVKE
jgi:holo-ACP synthase CitX